MHNLPRGVFYDPNRKRYRVRISYDHQVIHLSYHKNLESALTIFQKVKAEKPKPVALPETTESDALVAFLREGN